jgi:hypothetical protein
MVLKLHSTGELKDEESTSRRGRFDPQFEAELRSLIAGLRVGLTNAKLLSQVLALALHDLMSVMDRGVVLHLADLIAANMVPPSGESVFHGLRLTFLDILAEVLPTPPTPPHYPPPNIHSLACACVRACVRWSEEGAHTQVWWWVCVIVRALVAAVPAAASRGAVHREPPDRLAGAAPPHGPPPRLLVPVPPPRRDPGAPPPPPPQPPTHHTHTDHEHC